MATTTRCKVWDFTNADDYTLQGDAAIAADALSLTSPALALPWATHWNPEPAYDGNGDAVLATGTTYTASTGGTPITLQDGMLVALIAPNLGTNMILTATLRADEGDSRDRAAYRIKGATFGINFGLPDGSYLSQWFSQYIGTTLREWRFWLKDKDQRLSVANGESQTHTNGVATDNNDPGTITLTHNGTTGNVVLGGGDGGTAAAPVLYYRRTGGCTLDTDADYTIPAGTTALGLMYAVADRDGGGTDVRFDIPLQYRVKDENGDWGAWTAVPDDGDLSDVVFVAGTSQIAWRFNDNTLDNAADPRYVPSVYYVGLTYSIETPRSNEDEVKPVLAALKAAIEADETVAAYTGWSGAEYLFESSEQPDLFQGCGVLIVPGETPEGQWPGGAIIDGKPIRGKFFMHSIRLDVWMRPDNTTHDIYMDDGGLFDLARDLRAALIIDPTLGATVTEVRIKTQRHDSLVRWKDEAIDEVPIISIDIEVQGKPFYGN